MDKDEGNEIVIDENVRTRGYEKYRRRRGKHFAEKLKWNKIIQHQNILGSDIRLTNLQFYVTLCSVNLDMNFLLCTFLAVQRSTPMIVLCGATLLLVMYNLPLKMLYLFIGKYTQTGFIKFWDFVPILKGTGYSTLFVSLLHEMYVISVCSLLISMLIDIYIFGADFTKCDFAIGSPSYSGCIASNPKYRMNYTKPVCSPHFLPSTVLYTNKVYTKAFQWWGEDGHFQPDFWIIALIVFVWFTILFVSYQGCQRFIKYTSFITLFLLLSMLVVSVFSIFIPGMGLYKRNWMSNDAFDIKSTANILAYSVLCNMPSANVFLGAMCPKSTNVGRACVFVTFVKLLITIYIVIWVNFVFNVLNNDYQLGYFDQCTDFTNFQMMTSLMADAMSRAVFGKVLIFVYYISLVLLIIVAAIIVTVASVESLIKELPENLRRFRFFTFATYICVAILTHLAMVTTGLMFHRKLTILYLMVFYILCTFLANIAVTFIYPIGRLCTDYFFLYGARPLEFWSIVWRTCPLLLMFCAVLLTIQLEATQYPKSMMHITITSLRVMCTVFYVPLIIYMLWIIYRYFHSHKKTPILSPEKSWGPHSEELREQRLNFFPDRDLKYLSHVPKCKHKCLIGSLEYVKEVKDQFRKLNELVESLKEKHNIPK